MDSSHLRSSNYQVSDLVKGDRKWGEGCTVKGGKENGGGEWALWKGEKENGEEYVQWKGKICMVTRKKMSEKEKKMWEICTVKREKWGKICTLEKMGNIGEKYVLWNGKK